MLREENTVNEIASEYGLNPVMVSRWKAEFLERRLERQAEEKICGILKSEKR